MSLRSRLTSTFECLISNYFGCRGTFNCDKPPVPSVASAVRSSFPVRVNGRLAEEFGVSRLSITVRTPATILDVLDALGTEYPESISTIGEAIPFVSGRHRNATEELQSGQEITLLMPAAGG